ncbi:cell division protein FtsH [Candidatus Falkowbacteria bacterium CG10_big_fil_rev_8_21_14_0_10_39_9]|uniref:ATP-dependent zinc metalloprotease FtsH n=1 Tax=Candidatus Falkowbacteria bacterium CG10_big_fil_rev_8_21_14_0_10_39_9 TaxID=1974566 RepID=A0A2M6WRA3_9BACT|nr:MAG: cell division protein FtsH [Candidatus Falkowbacteria bacterium CG10_big_fil_rev_8_21_14_0_10_39_9]
MKNLLKNFLIYFLAFLIIASLFSVFSSKTPKSDKVGLEFLVSELNSNQISSIVVNGDELQLVMKDGAKKVAQKETGESLSSLLKNFNVDSQKLVGVDIKIKEADGMSFWLTTILPILLPILLIGAFLYFTMRGVASANSRAMTFGQSGAKEFQIDQKNKVTFGDIAGAKEAKEELKEVVEFLRFPKKFHDLGARIPKGVLLLGSPGTGKTLMARGVAGEANVPFFHISGSEFVEMFVGVGASRVRSLFQKAKKSSPCIVFIDEIDAVGRKRGSGMGGSHDEREQTLNQILVEMDGFEPTDNIIVIAATNRPDVLDPALLRPGRFDRQVVIDIPDIKERDEILQVHARKKPLTEGTDLHKIAERTPGFSGADLENVLNEAAILAARKDKKTIGMEEMFESVEKVMMGPERKSRVITDKEKKITAYHEAGHAIVAHFLPNTDAVHKVSIIARGSAGGYTLKLPSFDRHMHSKTEYIEELAVLLAGHFAEKQIFGEVTTGATSDLRRATALARSLITDFGMSEVLGPRTFGQKEEMIFLGREIHEQRDYSERVAEKIDEEINSFITTAGQVAVKIINEKREYIEKIVAELLEKETIEREVFESIVGPKVA